jgi:hypothetical protein
VINRRRFLRGLFGVAVAIPFLESLSARKAAAGPGDVPPFAIFMRQANGVVQQTGDEPEMFWPRNLGALTTESMAADGDRAVSELMDYADKLILLRGVNFALPPNGCAHSGGGNQCLTAARVSSDPSGNASLAMGESIDNRIARELNPAGVEPLTLYAARWVATSTRCSRTVGRSSSGPPSATPTTPTWTSSVCPSSSRRS